MRKNILNGKLKSGLVVKTSIPCIDPFAKDSRDAKLLFPACWNSNKLIYWVCWILNHLTMGFVTFWRALMYSQNLLSPFRWKIKLALVFWKRFVKFSKRKQFAISKQISSRSSGTSQWNDFCKRKKFIISQHLAPWKHPFAKDLIAHFDKSYGSFLQRTILCAMLTH